MNARASAVVVKDNQVLLMRRFVKGRGEYWVFPGGGVEEGETIEQAMKREVLEELSLTVTECKPLFDFFNEFTLGGKYPPRQDYYFLVTGFTGEVALGGEEAERMSEDDQYIPTWVPLGAIATMDNLKPETAREKVIEILKLQ